MNSIAYCGLACCVCSGKDKCVGCQNGGCDVHGWCKNYNCCREKGLNGCWECPDFPCSGNMLDMPRIRAFARFAKEYGTDELMRCLLRNKENGIVYHYDGQLVGDYDKCKTEVEIFNMIKTGNSKMKKPYVISISSVSGGGKTTVSNALKEELTNAAIISFDNYDDVYLDKDINEWSANGNDENEWHIEPIVKDLEKTLALHYDYIIIDYPFGRNNDEIGKYINLAVFIDTPLDIALARRTIRDFTSRGEHKHKIEVSVKAIEKELRSYLEISRPTYARMAETQIPYSDLVVDGTKTVEDILREIKGCL